MTATSVAPTAPRPAAVASVLARASQWTHGSRKSDGREFYFIPGSLAGTVYMADAVACTCPDANQRQRVCKHSLAVAAFQARQQRPAPTFTEPADVLAQLEADHAEHGRRLRLLGYERDELLDNAVYAERAGQIARLQARGR